MEGLRGRYMFLLLILAVSVKYSVSAADENTVLRAYVGTTVGLPCIVDKKQCGELHSVKWYKDANRVYILSHTGEKRPEGEAIQRMSVQFSNESVEAVLKISPVHAEDEATYKCEITYLDVMDNCNVIQIVNLKTLRKPDTIRVLDGSGNELKNDTTLAPRKERDEIELTCEAVGGKPVPSVLWFNGTAKMERANYTVTGKDKTLTGRSVLKLSLSRGDILATFKCQVESEALDEPIIYSITTDVHVPPTKVNLMVENNHAIQGTEVTFTCKVPDARPPATVTWKNESSEETTDITDLSSSRQEYDNKTYTTISNLVFKSSYYQNGDRIYCYATNKIISGNGRLEHYGSTTLDVLFPPVFTFTAYNITRNETSKNNTVDMSCFFNANPQDMKAIVWSKDGRNLTLSDTNKYDGGTIIRPIITIKNVDREDMGEYTCSVRNEVGAETSEGIYLNVQYPPDVEVVMEPSTPIKAEEKSTVLLECNVTSGNPAILEKVRWFLDGQLMKEFPECNYTNYDENGVGEGYGGPFCGLDPSILSLEKVDETFSGNYTCQGMNLAGWGNESEPKELIVYYPPSPPMLKYSPSDVVKGKSVTLECIVQNPGNPDNLTYIWYRGSHPMEDYKVSSFKISPVSLKERSNFTCTAVNEGGRSKNATVFINVNAPPAFLYKPPTYQGVLYSSKYINLTCGIECYPECPIIWKKDGIILNTDANSLYSVETKKLPAKNNDFESINSTLIWNLDRWPNKQLNKSSPNSNYTCESMNNSAGDGVSSQIEIAVFYPPENIQVSPKLVNVIENDAPSPVKCQAEGFPKPTYIWRKNSTSTEPIVTNENLILDPMKRWDTGGYTCEATNKHGSQFAVAYFNVQYPPECSISIVEKDSSPALLCTVRANPQEVTFTWKGRESNETFTVSSTIKSDGLQSYLFLDSSVDTARTYYCFANNSVGNGTCERDVAGNLPWWKQLNQDKMIIIIASIIAIIIIVIIICIIIIIMCRRKRADTKSPNPSSIEDKARLGAAPPVGGTADPLSDPDKGFYENLPFHGMQNPPNKPYRPDPCDLEYADVDYKSYGPINYKAASIYAAMKRNKNNNKMEEVNKEDLL